MRNIKLFLASANNLKKDRDELMIFLANKNQFLVKHGIFLEIVRWEFLSSSFSETRKQDDFNLEVKTSEIFTCLIFDRIGKYTREEFDTAYRSYKEGKNPHKFYLYFKEIPKHKVTEQSSEVFKFRAQVELDEQIYRDYKNSDQLKVYLSQNLDQDLPEILTATLQDCIQNQETLPETHNVPDYILDNLDDADHMLNKKLIRDAKEIYEESIKVITKKKNPVMYAKIKTKLAECIIDLSKNCGEEEENELQKAVLYLEEISIFLDPEINGKDLAKVYYYLSIAHTILSDFRDSSDHFNKAILYGKKALDYVSPKNDRDFYRDILITLGTTYRALTLQTNLIQHHNEAHGFLEKALTYCNPSTDGILFASIYKDLADINIYFIRMSTNREENIQAIETSINYCKKALTYVKMEKDPLLYYKILEIQANSYRMLGSFTKELSYFDQAFVLLKEILTFHSRIPKSYEHVICLGNLALFLQGMYSKTKNPAILDESIHYAEILESLITIESNPKQYGLLKRLQGRNFWYKATNIDLEDTQKVEDLKQAIETTEICFRVFTRTENVPEYSHSLGYMAQNYLDLVQMTNNPLHIAKAEEYLEACFSLYEDNLLNEDVNYANSKKLELKIKSEKERLEKSKVK